MLRQAQHEDLVLSLSKDESDSISGDSEHYCRAMASEDYIAAPVGEGLLLARQHGGRLYALNDSARFLWEQRSSGLPESQLAAALADAYGIEPAVAERDVRATLRRWREDGLIGAPEVALSCRLAGRVFALRLAAADMEAALRPLLAPLADATAETPAAALSVERDSGQLRMALGEEPPDRFASVDEAVAAVLAGLARLAFDTADWQLALHGAAVAGPSGCILLPGLSGSGKTTLLAALLARGFDHAADDLVLLGGAEAALQPLPLPLVLKRGSWRLLGRLLPELADAPVYRRLGQDVKYWLPPAERIARRALPVRAIVFPRFAGAAGAAATPLAPFAALARIMESPARVGRPLAGPALQRLAAWLESCPAYEVAHDDAAAAAGWAASLLAG
jgi:hypothetical protein